MLEMLNLFESAAAYWYYNLFDLFRMKLLFRAAVTHGQSVVHRASRHVPKSVAVTLLFYPVSRETGIHGSSLGSASELEYEMNFW